MQSFNFYMNKILSIYSQFKLVDQDLGFAIVSYYSININPVPNDKF